ncbi:MAG: rhodanese-like domain-containing protein [Verrucomicrobia bacterium]|nr:rhodanese-like domain-containing protein [Verrucomicrobiota bacterium]
MFLLRPLLAVLFATLALRSACAAEIKPVAPPEAARLVKEGKAVLVDVREPPEWRDSGVAEPAVLLPMSDFNGEQRQWKDFLAKNRDKQILLYCRSGGRSAAVAESLVGKGYKAANIGTLRDWTKAGLPVRKVE